MVAAELAGRVENVPDPSTLMYEDYVNLPDDGRRYEILDGELAVSPSPTSRHQLVSHNLDFALSSWVRAKGPGRTWPAPLALILAATVVMQADLIFVSKSRSAIVTTRGLVAVPDLVIEILSESSTSRDRGVKVQLYALRGAAYQRTATHGDDDHAHFDAPAGFAMNLADA
jgi:Uma2 family endonuclease